jgi:hypothetical protein
VGHPCPPYSELGKFLVDNSRFQDHDWSLANVGVPHIQGMIATNHRMRGSS